MSDITRSPCGTKFVIYVDDTSALISDNNLCSLEERDGSVLSDLKTWLTNNRLILNGSKTKFIVSFLSDASSVPSVPSCE